MQFVQVPMSISSTISDNISAVPVPALYPRTIIAALTDRTVLQLPKTMYVKRAEIASAVQYEPSNQ